MCLNENIIYLHSKAYWIILHKMLSANEGAIGCHAKAQSYESACFVQVYGGRERETNRKLTHRNNNEIHYHAFAAQEETWPFGSFDAALSVLNEVIINSSSVVGT